MDISEVIKTLRKENGYSQTELGDIVGLKKSAINKYETGRVENPKRTTIEKFAEIFNVSPSYIMGWESDRDLIDNLEVHRRIKKLIEIEGVSLTTFCEKVGCTFRTLSIVLNELKPIRQGLIDKICDSLKVNRDWLLYGNGDIYNISSIDNDEYSNRKKSIIYITNHLTELDPIDLEIIKNTINSFLIKRNDGV